MGALIATILPILRNIGGVILTQVLQHLELDIQISLYHELFSAPNISTQIYGCLKYVKKNFQPLLSFRTLRLLFFPNLPTPTFIPDRTFISDPRVSFTTSGSKQTFVGSLSICPNTKFPKFGYLHLSQLYTWQLKIQQHHVF